MSLPYLPPAIAKVASPKYFWPSSWASMEECKLKVWGAAEARDPLPESAEAVFGTLLHDAKKRFREAWSSQCDGRQYMKETLALELKRTETLLAEQGHHELVPLKQAVEWHRWVDRIQRLFTWAGGQLPNKGSGKGIVKAESVHHGCAAPDDTDRFSLGREPLWQCVGLRLRGRPDEAVFGTEGCIDITDLKTGTVWTEDGQIAPAIRMQLYLYGLMAESLVPGKSVRLLVNNFEESKVPWSEQERNESLVRLNAIRAEYPVGSVMDAVDVSRPGPQCITCRIRHRCGNYLNAVPAWWPNGKGHPRPLPWDVWGRLESIRACRGGWSVWMRDPAGRRVQVEGIKPDRPLEDVRVGDELFFFGLEPAEDVRPHGLRIQPLNFFETAPGPPWRSARGVNMYRGQGSL